MQRSQPPPSNRKVQPFVSYQVTSCRSSSTTHTATSGTRKALAGGSCGGTPQSWAIPFIQEHLEKGGKQRSPKVCCQYTVTQGSQNSGLIMKSYRRASQNPASEQ